MSDLSGLLNLPEHCAQAAETIRRHPESWCQGRMHDRPSNRRCGLGWVLYHGGYNANDEITAISIVNRANFSIAPGRPFVMFNDRPNQTPQAVADRLDQIAEHLRADDLQLGFT